MLLFFWVTKKKLEVPTGPEVQTPRYGVWLRAKRRGSGWQEGAQLARGLRAPGKPGRGLGAASR